MIRPRSFSYSPEWFRTVICAVSFALVGWFLFPNPTEADLIVSGTDTLASPATWTNQNAERTDTIGWTVTFPANVTVDWVPATGTYNPASGGSASIEGTMTITANFPIRTRSASASNRLRRGRRIIQIRRHAPLA